MAQYMDALGEWAIYSVQKNLSELGYSINHAYLVLVDPEGNAVLEMQGVPSNGFTPWASSGDYLRVRMETPNEYIADNSIESIKLVSEGSESTIVSAFNTAFSDVVSGLNEYEDLYVGGPAWLVGTPYNSNSVWYTAMLSLQAQLGFSGSISSYVEYPAPGDDTNLTLSGDNALVTGTSTDPSFTTNYALDNIRSEVGMANTTLLLDGSGETGYMLGVMNQSQTQLLYFLLSSDAVFDSEPNEWNRIATKLGTFSNNTILISGTDLKQLNLALYGGTDPMTAGGIIYVPTAVNTSVSMVESNQTSVYDPTTQKYYTVMAPFGGSDAGCLILESSGNPTTLAANTIDGSTASGSIVTTTLTYGDPTTLGTLAFNTSTDAGTVTLTDGTTISLSGLGGDDVLAPSSTDTPEQALLSYLANLGDSTTASALDTLNFDFQNPTGPAYTVTGDIGGTDDDFSVGPGDPEAGAPGAVITGVSGYTNVLDGVDVDLTQDTISDIQELAFDNNVELTGSQFSGFTSIAGDGGTITVDTSGSYSLADVGATTWVEDFIAGGWGGTTLTGNDEEGQTLTASLFGNDTLNAGNGAGDALIAGEGVDALNGGTGGDTFEAYNGLADGSSVTGQGTGNILEANGDISGATISDVQTLKVVESEITLTAAQLASFSSVTVSGVIYASGGGTFSLAGLNADAITADAADDTTLTGNGFANEWLIASGSSGNDTLTAGNGAADTLDADDSTGTDTLTAGNGTLTTSTWTLAATAARSGRWTRPAGTSITRTPTGRGRRRRSPTAARTWSGARPTIRSGTPAASAVRSSTRACACRGSILIPRPATTTTASAIIRAPLHATCRATRSASAAG